MNYRFATYCIRQKFAPFKSDNVILFQVIKKWVLWPLVPTYIEFAAVWLSEMIRPNQGLRKVSTYLSPNVYGNPRVLKLKVVQGHFQKRQASGKLQSSTPSIKIEKEPDHEDRECDFWNCSFCLTANPYCTHNIVDRILTVIYMSRKF